MIDKPVTDLPEPDSPTIASISLSPTLKLTPSTALSVPSGVVKLVFRPRTSMIVSRAPSAAASVNRIALDGLPIDLDAEPGA